MSREFTPEFKKEALRIVEELGGNISAAADHLDIPTRLLTCWVRRQTLEQVSQLTPLNTTVDNNQNCRKNTSTTTWPSGALPKPPSSRLGANGLGKKQGLGQCVAENVDVLSTSDSRMVSTFLSTIHSMTADMLKFNQNQIGTVYPIEVEMSLPELVHDYCLFDLLVPDSAEGRLPESIQFTVLLSATAAGDKLKPVMLVKGCPEKLNRSILPPDVEVVVKDSIVFNAKAFANWKQDIWCPSNDKNALIIVHMTEVDSSLTPVYQNIGYLHENTMVALMPKNLTCLVHPAIVFWIQPFAEMLRVRLAEWLEESEEAFVSLRRRRTANYELFAVWVWEAWDELDKELIVESFEACGLTHFTPTSLHSDLQRVLDHYAVSQKRTSPDVPVVDLVSDDDDDDVQTTFVGKEHVHTATCGCNVHFIKCEPGV